MSLFELFTSVSRGFRLTLGIDFISPPSGTHLCLSSFCQFFFFTLKAAFFQNHVGCRDLWVKRHRKIAQCSWCLLTHRQNESFEQGPWWRNFSFLWWLLVFMNALGYFLQVVGMDTDQRPFSRGDSAGQGQGSQPGGSEGPEGRLGLAKTLGGKLCGE